MAVILRPLGLLGFLGPLGVPRGGPSDPKDLAGRKETHAWRLRNCANFSDILAISKLNIQVQG